MKKTGGWIVFILIGVAAWLSPKTGEGGKNTMRYEDAIEATKKQELVTDGDHVYKIIDHKRFPGNLSGFIIQRQTLGIPFDEIDVDPITVTGMRRVNHD